MNEAIKYCKFCDKEKPIKEFCKSGFAIKNICKECQNKKQTKIYQESKLVKNLQQENNKLKKEKEDLQNELDSANSRVCDLAKRIVKAIKWIENNKIDYEYENISFSEWDGSSDPNYLLEILKGEDK